MYLGLVFGTCFSLLSLFSAYVWGQKLPNSRVLDPAVGFTVSWEVVGDKITIELQAKTTGYVGFGISPSGTMTGAYIVIGWINKNGQPELHHGKSTGHKIPTWSVPQKDYAVLSASNAANTLTIRFQRKLTAENSGDFPITTGPMTFIYAHHPALPADRNSIEQHTEVNRGPAEFPLIP